MEKVGLRRLMIKVDPNFFKEKNILITGHTGFKGFWLTRILVNFGADVCGYSLEPNTDPNLFNLTDLSKDIKHVIGDIRDFEHLKNTFDEFKPELVIHLAAQPLVRESYQDPRYTYETNVMGTVNLLECVRQCDSVRSVLNVTTDKVYKNNEWCWGYREDEPLDGYDPYSNSKSCSELVTHSYINSFFKELDIPVSTARAGNVIGGGDFSKDRIIPDCVKAALSGKDILVRNSNSTRPYQHVLEPLFAYLLILQEQYKDHSKHGFYNVGPDEKDCVTTAKLVEIFCQKWGNNQSWNTPNAIDKNAPHEANFLKLDCSKIKSTFGWHPKWGIEEAVEQVCAFSKLLSKDPNLLKQDNTQESTIKSSIFTQEMDREISLYMEN